MPAFGVLNDGNENENTIHNICSWNYFLGQENFKTNNISAENSKLNFYDHVAVSLVNISQKVKMDVCVFIYLFDITTLQHNQNPSDNLSGVNNTPDRW